MCKHLARLLEAEQPLFSISIEQLERASGKPSADIQLTAEIIGKVHQKTKELGLDPHDTTGPELYLALKELVKVHDYFIADRLGAKDPTDVEDVLPRLIALVHQLDVPRRGWFLKHSSAKRLLKSVPPKKVMKQLNYRSVDSMLKRESVTELFAAIRFIEPPIWQQSFLQKYARLTPQDFELREIEILQIREKKWGVAAKQFSLKKGHNITNLKELGAVVVLPLPVKHMNGISIAVLPLLLHYINEVRLYSALFKIQQIVPHFGDVVAETLLKDPDNYVNISDQGIHWRVLHRYFGKLGRAGHPEIFEPHLQPEDLHWRKAEDVLYRIEPALYFWRDMDFVATIREGQTISFNLMDMAANYVNDLPFGKQISYHFRDSLWNEVYIRYLGQRSLEQQVLKQLEAKLLSDQRQPFSLEGIL